MSSPSEEKHANNRRSSSPDRVTASTPDPLEKSLDTKPEEQVIPGQWAGGIRPAVAKMLTIRLGKRWFNILWLIPIAIVILLVGVAICQWLRTIPAVEGWIQENPGTGAFQPPVETGFPLWVRIQHLLNLTLMLFIIRAGLQILADHPRLQVDSGSYPGKEFIRMNGPVPPERMVQEPPEQAWTAKDDAVSLPGWLGIPGQRHSIGLARWWHFSCDFLWLINGLLFYILLFSTNQWQRLVPRDWDVFPAMLSTGIQYMSLTFPANEGYTQYNGLQITAYFLTVFVAAPLAMITGLLQAPAVSSRLGLSRGPLNRQVARVIHFCVLCWFIFFIVVHTVMIYITGFLGNVNHIFTGQNNNSVWGLVWYVAMMVVVIALWAWATPFTLKHPRVVQKVGSKLVGWIKFLMEWRDTRTTYKEKDISPYFWPNGTLPTEVEEYQRLKANDFKDYKLRIDGLVENPTELTFDEIKALPKSSQITQHFCIQGWSAIGQWEGVQMSEILKIVKPKPEAKWVVFYSFAPGSDGGLYYDCHQIAHMSHELTILAYEMNGEPLNELHGAPIRLRNELELGFKMVKWVQAIEFVESFEHLGAGQGGYNEDHEFYGYRMPI